MRSKTRTSCQESTGEGAAATGEPEGREGRSAANTRAFVPMAEEEGNKVEMKVLGDGGDEKLRCVRGWSQEHRGRTSG